MDSLEKYFELFRKKTIGLIIFFIAVLLFSAQFVHAAYIPVLSDILEAPLRIGLAVVVTAITFGLGVIQLLTAAFCYIGATLVKWVVTTPVRLTSGGVVDVGWAFCRDFSNMFFIVVLLVLAYATMLKKETFGIKQAPVPLILMALLINFSQVIAGVIVDISNIFMNFFIQNGAADAGYIFIEQNVFIKDVLGIGSDKFWGPFAQVFGKPFSEVAGWAVGVTIKGIVGVLFNIVEFLILLAYGLILTLRIVIIWILVILSPIAFICYVLPATKSFWQMWWKNFIQWATVGIILLFFLYLAGYLMAHSSDADFFASCKMPAASQPGNEDAIGWGAHIMAEYFCALLPSIAGLIFLLLGLFLGISGAGGMPSFAQKIMQTPTNKFTGAITGAATGFATSRTKDVTGRMASRLAETKAFSQWPVLKQLAGKPLRKYGEATVKGEIGKMEQRYGTYSKKAQLDEYEAGSGQQKVANVSSMIDKDIDVRKEFEERFGKDKAERELAKIFSLSKRYNLDKKIAKVMPTLLGTPQEIDEVFSKMTGSDMAKLKASDIEDPRLEEPLLKHIRSTNLREMALKMKKEDFEVLKQFIDKNSDRIRGERPDLARWLDSEFAQDAGFDFPPPPPSATSGPSRPSGIYTPPGTGEKRGPSQTAEERARRIRESGGRTFT